VGKRPSGELSHGVARGRADQGIQGRVRRWNEGRGTLNPPPKPANAGMAVAMQQLPDDLPAGAPGATVVAGFNRWKSLGRFVKKGEKGIAIFAPCK
jgi:hypothetical protein